MRPCDECPRRADCSDPCDRLEALLDSPDRGRLPEGFSSLHAALAQASLENADLLPARDRAIVNLYFRCGLSMAEIAQAFGIHRANVGRCLHRARRRVGPKRLARRARAACGEAS